MPDIDDTTETITPQQEASCEVMDTNLVQADDQVTDEHADKPVNYIESNNDNADQNEGNIAVIESTKENNFEVVDADNEVLAISETQPSQCAEMQVQVQEVQNVTTEEVEQSIIETQTRKTDEHQQAAIEDHTEDNQKLEENKIEEENGQVAIADEQEINQEPQEVEMQDELQTVIQENPGVTENTHVAAEEINEPLQEHVELEDLQEKGLEAQDPPPREIVEIQEEITEHVEEIVKEIVESEEVVTEKNNDDQEQCVEEVTTQVEKNITDDVEEITCQTQDQPEIDVQPQVDPQLHVEESQMGETGSYMEINLQTEEVSSQIDETPSQIDENSGQNESADEIYKDDKFHEETSQTDDKITYEEQTTEEGVSSLDENSQSQDSQTSQCSSRQEELIREFKKTTSQATKISILNDWEDTEDSQQSDNVTKKAELTVNKLIHDWDDDDEEGKNEY